MELELKHIAPYLPYGLKAMFGYLSDFEYRVIKITGVTHYEHETHPTRVRYDWYDSELIWMFKPILYPLSDLTKEIEYNGKKINPLAELYKIASGLHHEYDKNDYDVRELQGNGYGFFDLERKQVLIFRDGDFTFHKDFDGVKCEKVNNQIKLFNKLSELKIDFLKLIPQGIAISVHDVDSEIYKTN
jgi:hypothetical protein